MTIVEVCHLYQIEKWTMRRIAGKFGTDHHRVKRLLVAAGVEITNANRVRAPLSDAHKEKIGNVTRGRKAWNKGVRADEQQIRKYIKARMRTQIDLDVYPDLPKLQFLIRITSRHYKHLGASDEARKAFLDKFYFDYRFNQIYDKWQAAGESKWYYPSIDHKVSKFNGENWDLDNLQFMTWFENRAKAEMNQDEWERFKLDTNTSSDLFSGATAQKDLADAISLATDAADKTA